MQEAIGSHGEASADIPESVALPILHGDVAREGVQQVDVAIGVVDGLPVVLSITSKSPLPSISARSSSSS
jgi:hypothetical protein